MHEAIGIEVKVTAPKRHKQVSSLSLLEQASAQCPCSQWLQQTHPLPGTTSSGFPEPGHCFLSTSTSDSLTVLCYSYSCCLPLHLHGIREVFECKSDRLLLDLEWLHGFLFLLVLSGTSLHCLLAEHSPGVWLLPHLTIIRVCSHRLKCPY